MDFVEYVPVDPTSGVGQWSVSINNQARAARVPACALAAIVARETGGRNILQEGVPPGPGCGCGLAQITAGVDWDSALAPTFLFEGRAWELLDPSSNLYIAGKAFLAPAIANCTTLQELAPQSFARWGAGQVLYYAFASYNAGFGAVSRAIYGGMDPDSSTTNSYAHDVISRYTAYVAASHAALKT